MQLPTTVVHVARAEVESRKSPGPVAWMVQKSLIIQMQLQVFFGYQAKIICKHPSRCIWGVMLWMALVLPASLLGNVELRNEEVLVSKTYASSPSPPTTTTVCCGIRGRL